MAYKKQKGGPKMYRKDKSPTEMASPAKNYMNMEKYSKPGDAVQFGEDEKDSPTDMGTHGKTPTYMKSSGFKMKSGSPFQRNFGVGASPMKVAGGKYVMEEDKEGYPVETQISTADYERMEQRNKELDAEAEKASERGDSGKAQYLYGQKSWLTKSGLENPVDGVQYTSLEEAQEALHNMPEEIEGPKGDMIPNPEYWNLAKVVDYEITAKGKGETERQRRLDMMDQ